MPTKPKAAFVLGHQALRDIYGPEQRRRIDSTVELVAEPMTKDDVAADPSRLRDIDVLFSGWGCPVLDADLLQHAERLKALFYGAGTIKAVMTDAAWERGLVVTTAASANAVPVAEFTVAQIVLSLKATWQTLRDNRLHHACRKPSVAGGFGSTVSLISLGMIGRMVAERLRDGYDLEVLACDPFCPEDDARRLGVTLVELDEAFERGDVVSCHTPLLDSTIDLIGGEQFKLMKQGATFINTSRGKVIDQPAMVQVLRDRPDLTALLDVTNPEPSPSDSPLWDLENVFVTPHIAGSMGRECWRMGSLMADEIERYVRGEPLLHAVTREQAAKMA
jgi:phosphoglycerate dehydrogenase-like enzyme